MMENTIRALNLLSAVIMLAAGMYIQIAFWPLLSPAVQGVIGMIVLVYFLMQVELCLRSERNRRESLWR